MTSNAASDASNDTTNDIAITGQHQPTTASPTELVRETGYEIVQGLCTPCHSAMLIVQNRDTREGWRATIRKMQTSQGMVSLDTQTETLILDYLSRHYPMERKGRRAPLPAAYGPDHGPRRAPAK